MQRSFFSRRILSVTGLLFLLTMMSFGTHVDAQDATPESTGMADCTAALGIGNEGRMNLPASESGNWFWRFADGSLTPEIVGRLRELTETYGREAR